tara:strand:+ start:1841 stop:4996 length:3156 start_codon:yes stop_codon:yes gene_type:complete
MAKSNNKRKFVKLSFNKGDDLESRINKVHDRNRKQPDHEIDKFGQMYAVFSDAAYFKSNAARNRLLDGFDLTRDWDVVDSMSGSDVVVMRNNGTVDDDNPNYVISYRGTSKLQDLAVDVHIAVGRIENTVRFEKASSLVDRLVKTIGPDKTIALTGHSLGGSLAYAVGQKKQLNSVHFNRGSGVLDSVRFGKPYNSIGYTTDYDMVSAMSRISKNSGEEIRVVGPRDMNPITAHNLSNFMPQEPIDGFYVDVGDFDSTQTVSTSLGDLIDIARDPDVLDIAIKTAAGAVGITSWSAFAARVGLSEASSVNIRSLVSIVRDPSSAAFQRFTAMVGDFSAYTASHIPSVQELSTRLRAWNASTPTHEIPELELDEFDEIDYSASDINDLDGIEPDADVEIGELDEMDDWDAMHPVEDEPIQDDFDYPDGWDDPDDMIYQEDEIGAEFEPPPTDAMDPIEVIDDIPGDVFDAADALDVGEVFGDGVDSAMVGVDIGEIAGDAAMIGVDAAEVAGDTAIVGAEVGLSETVVLAPLAAALVGIQFFLHGKREELRQAKIEYADRSVVNFDINAMGRLLGADPRAMAQKWLYNTGQRVPMFNQFKALWNRKGDIYTGDIDLQAFFGPGAREYLKYRLDNADAFDKLSGGQTVEEGLDEIRMINFGGESKKDYELIQNTADFLSLRDDAIAGHGPMKNDNIRYVMVSNIYTGVIPNNSFRHGGTESRAWLDRQKEIDTYTAITKDKTDRIAGVWHKAMTTEWDASKHTQSLQVKQPGGGVKNMEFDMNRKPKDMTRNMKGDNMQKRPITLGGDDNVLDMVRFSSREQERTISQARESGLSYEDRRKRFHRDNAGFTIGSTTGMIPIHKEIDTHKRHPDTPGGYSGSTLAKPGGVSFEDEAMVGRTTHHDKHGNADHGTVRRHQNGNQGKGEGVRASTVIRPIKPIDPPEYSIGPEVPRKQEHGVGSDSTHTGVQPPGGTDGTAHPKSGGPSQIVGPDHHSNDIMAPSEDTYTSSATHPMRLRHGMMTTGLHSIMNQQALGMAADINAAISRNNIQTRF